MDKLTNYRNIIQKVLEDYAAIPYHYGDLKAELIISKDENRYLIITSGWENNVRVHACIIHLDIINNKIWIQRDSSEDGIALDLMEEGIPKEDIVLGFHPPKIRAYTEFAVN
ncbi:XisI protein [Crocosphaera sp. XPORK-15E]|uniref:XisI protein n=1 Tax=Crocosphaera sp. XPORK-15E TaxID=3110247 RepID=UPI002B211BF8|nr:XisI protein [Crocosphaera sp. XPORK-15E]MEA5533974.1 XisI protein [Crocosphaera sp. XPORK-15E]